MALYAISIYFNGYLVDDSRYHEIPKVSEENIMSETWIAGKYPFKDPPITSQRLVSVRRFLDQSLKKAWNVSKNKNIISLYNYINSLKFHFD